MLVLRKIGFLVAVLGLILGVFGGPAAAAERAGSSRLAWSSGSVVSQARLLYRVQGRLSAKGSRVGSLPSLRWAQKNIKPVRAGKVTYRLRGSAGKVCVGAPGRLCRKVPAPEPVAVRASGDGGGSDAPDTSSGLSREPGMVELRRAVGAVEASIEPGFSVDYDSRVLGSAGFFPEPGFSVNLWGTSESWCVRVEDSRLGPVGGEGVWYDSALGYSDSFMQPYEGVCADVNLSAPALVSAEMVPFDKSSLGTVGGGAVVKTG